MIEIRNPEIHCITPSVTSGVEAEFEVIPHVKPNFTYAEIEVFTCDVPNPTYFAGGKGKLGDSDVAIKINIETKAFGPGIYEVRKLRLFNIDDEGQITEELSFFTGTSFKQVVFEIRDSNLPIRTAEIIAAELVEQQSRWKREFENGYDLVGNNAEGEDWAVLVFIVGVLVSVPVKSSKWQVIPFLGMDGKDELDIVNSFFKSNFRIENDVFQYGDPLQDLIQRDKPTFAMHFPRVRAESIDAATEFASNMAHKLCEVYGVLRGSAGSIFNIALYNKRTKHWQLQTPGKPYTGNLLTGIMAMENPRQILFHMDRLEKISCRYIYSLYREVLAERNPDLMYLRYWSILEALSELKNYSDGTPLKDSSNCPILRKNGTPMNLDSAPARVYTMLKESYANSDGTVSPGIDRREIVNSDGSKITHTLWEYVYGWYAFRNATAHFGGFRDGDPVQCAPRPKGLRDYGVCKQFHDEFKRQGHDFLLHDLRHAAEWVLVSARTIF